MATGLQVLSAMPIQSLRVKPSPSTFLSWWSYFQGQQLLRKRPSSSFERGPCLFCGHRGNFFTTYFGKLSIQLFQEHYTTPGCSLNGFLIILFLFNIYQRFLSPWPSGLCLTRYSHLLTVSSFAMTPKYLLFCPSPSYMPFPLPGSPFYLFLLMKLP